MTNAVLLESVLTVYQSVNNVPSRTNEANGRNYAVRDRTKWTWTYLIGINMRRKELTERKKEKNWLKTRTLKSFINFWKNTPAAL